MCGCLFKGGFGVFLEVLGLFSLFLFCFVLLWVFFFCWLKNFSRMRLQELYKAVGQISRRGCQKSEERSNKRTYS